MDTGIEEKVMPLPEDPEKEFFPENLRRPTLWRIRMEYMSFDRIVTMFLRVVAPQTPVMIDGIWGDPQTLTFFLLASPNLKDEIHLRVVGL